MQIWKLGGSLLSRRDLAVRLDRLLQQSVKPPDEVLMICGGGPAADLVRNWDSQFQFGERIAHHLAIGSLTLTATLLSELLPQSGIAASRRDAERFWQAGRLPVGRPDALLNELAETGLPAPFQDWEFTTDSIAAWLSVCWGAERLVLIKSTEHSELDLQSASEAGLVDRHFPEVAAEGPRIDWVNLRSDALQIDRWYEPPH